MTTNQYRKWYIKNHRVYERTAFSIVRKRLKAILVKYSKLQPTETTFKVFLKQSIKDQDIFDMLYELYLTIGLVHGERIRRGIINDSLNVKRRNVLFDEELQTALINWLTLNAGNNIVSIRETFVKTVIDYMISQLEETNNVSKVVSNVINKFGQKEGFYRYQIMRIVRTETAAAANFAALQAMESENLIIDKVWISTNDNRTRGERRNSQGQIINRAEFDHIEMNGVTIPKDEMFAVPSGDGKIDYVMFPADPQGDPANVIQCRCTIASKPRRDSNGRLIFKKLLKHDKSS